MPIIIEGLSDLSNMLTKESARTAKRYLLNVAKPAAQVVLDAMEQTVPVGVTERLEEGLGYQTKYLGTDETTLTIRIGPSWKTFWGMFQEFGTADQPAQHWMERAWTGCKDKCLSVFATEALARLADMENK